MNKRRIGTQYETQACAYLTQKRYVILERNYRCRQGEIDIIAKDLEAQMLVFCEVKYRHDNSHGDPLEAVDDRKQRQICRTALVYYTYHGYTQETPCRFDVIAIYGDGQITHIENAFAYTRS